MRAVFALVIGVAFLAPPTVCIAQNGGTAPLYHGALEVRRSRGVIHPDTGSARMKVSGWVLRPRRDSNDIRPDAEALLIAVGEETFRLPAGSLKSSRRGKRFSYRAPKEALRGVRSLRMQRRDDGSYALTIRLFEIDLSRLIFAYPACVPMAIIVGDDDGFSGVTFNRAGFDARSLTVTGTCTPSENWAWLERCGPDMTDC